MKRIGQLRRYRLDLLPLAVAAIVVATAIPIELRAPAGWSAGVAFSDVAENLLLYAPLGIALWRWRPGAVLLGAFMLSAIIEFTQLWHAGRFASPVDIGANTLGAVLGALLWRRLAPRTACRADRPMLGPTAFGLALATACALGANWAIPLRSASLDGWHAEFPLRIGSEAPGERHWQGTIHYLAVVPRMLTAPELAELARSQSVALHDAIVNVHGPLRIDERTVLELPAESSRRLVEQVSASNRITLIAHFTPGRFAADSSATIASFAQDFIHRNFDLAQEGRHLVLRLQAGVSGEHANWVLAKTDAFLEPGRDYLVVASHDGGIARITVDGSLRARRSFAAETCAMAALCDSALLPAWLLFGSCLAVLALGVFPCTGRTGRIVLCAAAGLGGVAFAALLPDSGGTGLRPEVPWAALAGAVIVGLSVREPDRQEARSAAAG